MSRFRPELSFLEDRAVTSVAALAPPTLSAAQVAARSPAPAPSADEAAVSDILSDVAQKYGVPGLTAAVIDGNRVVVGAGGVRQAGTNTPVRPGDTFHNGSTGKAMTSTLAGVLVDRGVVRWDTTLGQVFPELRGQVRSEHLNVTLEQLLQHRGGLIADEDASPALQERYFELGSGNPTAGRRAILKDVLNEPPPNQVGTFRYSNAGYAAAGAMLEKLTGQSYERLMKRYVFDPLGMTTATFVRPLASRSGSPVVRPVGHQFDWTPVPDGDPTYQLTDNPLTNPAGANLRMSAADWAKFVRVHLGETVNGTRLVTPATLARLHAPASGGLPVAELGAFAGYGMGWGTRPAGFDGRDPALGAGLWHDGSDNLWLAEVESYPGKRFAVLIMANSAATADGDSAETTAFAEVKQRLLARFAPDRRDLSAFLTDTLRANRGVYGVPALAGGVIVDGKVAAVGAVGVREAGKPTAVTVGDTFHLGSNGKSMTATLAAVLVEKRVIRWDTTVVQMFPEVRDRINPAYRNVTLEDLLNHRGGFADVDTEDGAARFERFQTSARWAAEGRQMFVRDWLLNVAPAGPRGEYRYSNVGYAVAGAMLERAANRGFEWLMREQIFQPLGMTTAGFGTPAAGGRNQPVGHGPVGRPLGDLLPNGFDILSPAGGMFMSVGDWAKFLQAHLGERVNGVRLLSPLSLAKLHTPDPRDVTDEGGTYRYGFGWRAVETPLGTALGSEGEFGGFLSRVGIIPARKVAVFVVANQLSEGAEAANTAVTNAVLMRLAGG